MCGKSVGQPPSGVVARQTDSSSAIVYAPGTAIDTSVYPRESIKIQNRTIDICYFVSRKPSDFLFHFLYGKYIYMRSRTIDCDHELGYSRRTVTLGHSRRNCRDFRPDRNRTSHIIYNLLYYTSTSDAKHLLNEFEK